MSAPKEDITAETNASFPEKTQHPDTANENSSLMLLIDLKMSTEWNRIIYSTNHHAHAYAVHDNDSAAFDQVVDHVRIVDVGNFPRATVRALEFPVLYSCDAGRMLWGERGDLRQFLNNIIGVVRRRSQVCFLRDSVGIRAFSTNP